MSNKIDLTNKGTSFKFLPQYGMYRDQQHYQQYFHVESFHPAIFIRNSRLKTRLDFTYRIKFNIR